MKKNTLYLLLFLSSLTVGFSQSILQIDEAQSDDYLLVGNQIAIFEDTPQL